MDSLAQLRSENARLRAELGRLRTIETPIAAGAAVPSRLQRVVTRATVASGVPGIRHALTVAAVVQNEARWLPEWLEYHLLPQIGVEHFYIYDDDSAGAGSTDGLAAAVAPYVEASLVTLHSVSSLGPLPTHSRSCGVRGGACYWRPIEFRQQAAMVRHAAATYGGRTRAMLFIDVDEFLLYETTDQAVRGASPLHPNGHSAATAIAAALSARRVGGVRLEIAVMLPNETTWEAGGVEAELVLTRDCVRQLVPASNATERRARGEMAVFKSVVAPTALAIVSGDGGEVGGGGGGEVVGGGGSEGGGNATHIDYGTIHSLSLRPGYEWTMGTAHGLRLLHFRYRSAASFAARANRTYLRRGQSVEAKQLSMRKWREVLQQTFRAKWRRSAPQLGLLSSWGALAAALARRWDGRPAPPAAAALLDAARAVAGRVAVLLVSEPRGGSSLVGEVAFDARPDFLYSFEPCRLARLRRTHIDGAYFDSRRARPPPLPPLS